MKFLTEPEVAEIMRCHPQKIKRLRLSGKLPYLPGRPVLIAEADLEAFLTALKMTGPRRGTGEAQSAVPESQVEDARAWALRTVLLKPKRKPPKR